ncbi:MAG: hypothetical protein WC307_00775 [Candidatus Nanoarchaeia archaeon]
MKKSLLCRLGLHRWGVKINYNDPNNSFIQHWEQECTVCGVKRKGTNKMDWDYS